MLNSVAANTKKKKNQIIFDAKKKKRRYTKSNLMVFQFQQPNATPADLHLNLKFQRLASMQLQICNCRRQHQPLRLEGA